MNTKGHFPYNYWVRNYFNPAYWLGQYGSYLGSTLITVIEPVDDKPVITVLPNGEFPIIFVTTEHLDVINTGNAGINYDILA